MQRKAALWILGAFFTSPTGEIEALAGLIPIQLHLKKLVKRSCLRAATLPSQHALMSLLSAKHSKGAPPHPQSLTLLNDIQCAHLKGPLLDTEASLLNLTECFNPLHAETTPDCRLLDSFLITSPSIPAIAQASGIANLTYSLLTIFVLRFLPPLLLLWWSLMQVLYPLDTCRLSLLHIFGIWANRCRPPRPSW